MKSLRSISVISVAVLCFVFATSGQSVKNYRLRANINPTCATSGSLKFSDIYADGNIAVMGSYNCRGVFIFNISNPDAPVLASWYNPGANLQFLEAIVIGNRGYFGTGNTGGVHIVDLTNPASPQLLGIVNAANGGGYPTIHEMMVFDQGGSRYLLENSNTGSNRQLRIIDVTNPAAAVLKWSFLSSDGGWVHAMHIRGNRLFLSGFTSSTRVDILDMSNLATQAPTQLGQVAVGLASNHSTWTSEDGNYLYSAREISDSAATNPGDIRVYNVSNPAQAMLVDRVSMADLGITAVTPHNPVVMGNKLYVAWYQAGTQVFDLADPTKPRRIGQYDTWPAQFTEEDLAEVRESTKKFDPDDMVCGVNTLTGQQIAGYNGNWAVFPFLGEDRVLLGDLATGLYIIDVTTGNNVSDFDGDGKTDYSTWSPTTGNWAVERSSNSSPSSLSWGQPGDVPVAADYDGDGKSDHAIFRASTGTWWFVMSGNGSRPAVQFGAVGDVPVTGDYDGDGKTDIAVFRPSTGIWYIAKSTGGILFINWGLADDKPLAVDHDGDGKSDVAVWRPSTGVWYVIRSSDSNFVFFGFGQNGDKPLVTDLNGDGRTEFTVFRPSTGIWHVSDPANGSYFGYNFGISTDVPVPADYDGDGKTDIAVFRPGTNDWYRLSSSNGAFVVRNYGSGGDIASPSTVQPQ
jgi:Uncharacterized conserved protein